ncbi:MAG: hypothetical protein NZ952_02110, partial [Candidatus Bathyarchaeota archaeon]|nr:hypothetical protein [Candidatus Bathyarchaeota archaeon]
MARYLTVAIICILSLAMCVRAEEVSVMQANVVPLWLILRFRDFNTNLPISNVKVNVSLFTDQGARTISALITNETGTVQFFLGNVLATSSFRNRRLTDIFISDNYTLIKVQNVFIEDYSASTRNYSASYSKNWTIHRGLQIDLEYNNYGNYHCLEGTIWLLRGKLVLVSDINPVNGKKETLFLVPAFKTNISTGNQFQSYYFFPINYPVTIFHGVRTWADYELQKANLFSPIITTVNDNTTLINWVQHAAEVYAHNQLSIVEDEIEWLRACGYPTITESDEYRAIGSLLERAVRLYEIGEYESALGGASICDQKLAELKGWFANIKMLAVATSIGISFFAYGLASLLASMIYEEASENRNRLLCKITVFSLILLMFSLTHPSMKIAYAIMVGGQQTGLALSLLGCLAIGILTYFFMLLFSIRKKAVTDLSVQLGIRSLKRRKSRTLLTLITITIMVSSAIVFVNISMNREIKIRSEWKGTSAQGIILKPNTYLSPLTSYDIEWMSAQTWCKELAYIEGIKPWEMTADGSLNRIGQVILNNYHYTVEILGVNPEFMQRYYNLAAHITAAWHEFVPGKSVAIVPTTLGLKINEYVTLAVEEILGESTSGRIFGDFRVVGTYDPVTSFTDLMRIDGTPLFQTEYDLILVPIGSINDPA